MTRSGLPRRIFLLVPIWVVFLAPTVVSASFTISEIAYDLPGSDIDREWVEVFNVAGAPIDLTGWKFFEANTNHGLKVTQGSGVVPQGGYAVIADNADTFLSEHQNFTGTLFDSSFSLGNTGETIALKNEAGEIVDTVTYSKDSGAAGDGNTLQKTSAGWIAASPTPGAANQTAAEPPASGDPSAGSGGSGSQSQAGSSSSGGGAPAGGGGETGSLPPPKPSISAEAGNDRTVVAGAPVVFAGLAYGFEGKPILNARFIWNFGDGETAEGQSVLHTYHVPGNYLAVLEASSGEFSASDRIKVAVIASPITIRRVVVGQDGVIELLNSAAAEIELSFWELAVGRASFRFPKNTFIAGGGTLPLPSSVTGLEAAPNDNVLLSYQNGSVAATFTVNAPVPTEISAVAANSPPKGNDRAPRVVVTVKSPKAVPLEPIASPANGVSQLAAVVQLAEETKNNPPGVSLITWIAAVGGVAFLGVISVLALRRRQGGASGFTIIEEPTEDQTKL